MLDSEPLKFLLKKLETPNEVETRLFGLVTACKLAASCVTENMQLSQRVLEIRRSLAEVGETFLETAPFVDNRPLDIRPENEFDIEALNGRPTHMTRHASVHRLSNADCICSSDRRGSPSSWCVCYGPFFHLLGQCVESTVTGGVFDFLRIVV